MANLKELASRPERLIGGHRLCAGCGASILVRQVLLSIDKPMVLSNATGCLEVATTIFPYTSWAVPWMHNAFENAAATISGAETAYRHFKRQGKIDKDIVFVAFGGDGGTYDIGIQSLSGAIERGHRFLYVCYDNQAYMNTGIQRSGSTPYGAHTMTSPSGKVIPGKMQKRKDLTMIIAAHHLPYAAQVSPSHWRDLNKKVEKAISYDGPTFINALSSCNRGWRHKMEDTIEILRVAVDTCVWPLYEIEEGILRITYKPREKKPVEEWLKPQGRYKHLFTPKYEHLIGEIQKDVDQRWERLQKLEGCFVGEKDK
ncbi:MAG: pyruvate ferredoxin oxidoreductase [Candidatus Coatesbacteria bacterium 4484_99]|uniref:Pyruvate ferredoxin oxidoreductase n=1 Tax=Candidatus Coatesbacteria bacterium 4484_99 TaxID=1970774 RepID=A0A1W9S2U5_9BACT|nr:MAG: pyruvate ferredoxin oxidoreductase [Candidatus Coatesbacteria bacterium 4484_99]RLC41592.1 MAG: pyruvate ferredoxin oxidoreductase [Candidatus Coatesbacteria bacterium]RLC44568.1 MAG: pyruvate ferredoxin oxidoreductase [Candidatus Coatesbacteria bacterium]